MELIDWGVADPDPEVRLQTLASFARRPGPDAIGSFLSLQVDEDARVRSRAGELLDQVDEGSIGDLRDLLRKVGSARRALQFVALLERLGWTPITPAEKTWRELSQGALDEEREPAEDALLVARFADDPATRALAEQGLARIGWSEEPSDPRGRADDDEPAVLPADADLERSMVLRRAGVGARFGVEALPGLREVARADSGEDRSWAATEIGSIDDPAAVEALVALAEDESAEVREAAVAALAAEAASEAGPALVRLLEESERRDVRELSAAALAQRDEPGAVAALRKALAFGQHDLRVEGAARGPHGPALVSRRRP